MAVCRSTAVAAAWMVNALRWETLREVDILVGSLVDTAWGWPLSTWCAVQAGHCSVEPASPAAGWMLWTLCGAGEAAPILVRGAGEAYVFSRGASLAA
mmetsp:Transcript_23401/g.46536  ORF Transcript_23401/g.46536 Transcript_23401/m.46536 type:complete len:98 (+) Transcript_23401:155-448(+)